MNDTRNTIILNKLQKEFDDIRPILDDNSEIYATTRRTIKQVVKEISNENLSKALDLLKNAKEMISKENDIYSIIKKRDEQLDIAKKMKISLPEHLLNNAKECINNGQFDKAIEYADQFKKESSILIRKKRQQQKALDCLKELRSYSKQLGKLSLQDDKIEIVEKSYELGKHIKTVTDATKFINEFKLTIDRSRPSLSSQLETTNFKLGGWRTQLFVSNEGNTTATKIDLSISGDVDTRLFSKIKSLNTDESKPIDIWIKPKSEGNLPIEISLKYNDGLGRDYESKNDVWINVGINEMIDDIDISSDLSISRETEFYQGFIRFKMSVTNTSSFVVNDVALDIDYDNNLLRIDKREPDYQIKNGRTIFGNISANSSKTIAVYFDPMMCSKGADINCQINYKDAKGQPQTTHMKPKQISVVCPIMETESDINIGRLKEFIEKLPYRDSKVYQIQNGFDIDVLKNISREIVQKHDVKHIRTLFTKDGNTCEIWYYGKTKVHGHDIVIKITILSETKSIELFAATETVESLAGLLAEVGRELKNAIESKVTGNVQQVINVSIKDSIVQRSNLLSYCDINDNCSGDVVIEDSLVQRSDVGLDAEVKDSVVQRTDVSGGFCTACGESLPDAAKFCMECGERLI